LLYLEPINTFNSYEYFWLLLFYDETLDRKYIKFLEIEESELGIGAVLLLCQQTQSTWVRAVARLLFEF